MIVDLVSTTTADGVKLHAALHCAAALPTRHSGSISDLRAPGGLDVLLCLPGVGGNFYGTTMADELTPLLTATGLDVLWVNTRGHDGIAVVHTRAGGLRQGSAFEIVDDCRHDITAWLDYLVGRGYRNPGLLGHSLGAIKSLYSQAFAPHASVRSILAISPPRLSCRAFQAGPDSPRFLQDLSTAQEHVRAGRPKQLMRARYPVPLIISAATYLDKYGPDERYNILEFVERIRCPHAFIYGGHELENGGIAFAGVPEALRGLGQRRFAAPVITVADADHMYTGRREPLARALLGWLADPKPAS